MLAPLSLPLLPQSEEEDPVSHPLEDGASEVGGCDESEVETGSEDDMAIGRKGAPPSLPVVELERALARLFRRLARMAKKASTTTKRTKKMPTNPTMKMVMISWVLTGAWES